ncbi:MAG: sodium:solute symporter family protein [Candidatus Marinimicrobia bacterium]|jgi:SSS family transporter|nr:sodium:solute symporter family protein [Candidatus Neomarinimicrobiota bacterium]MBT3840110.1 sodium:solute symporter family protein [Candidatus Neomarinimicrobiota bacterium]MBT3999995.1 sodium:solute symporter family protein [Candidatus Neomarinimicrobiota bacterium]MBT4282971.1 sodium:solute symporter family protein [Candidatus Neomarinimicrobiota bacterium]MBT4579488.1 sodium:solute symporter family protein [Candidatus Neomarinimicrobiota bacterium]
MIHLTVLSLYLFTLIALGVYKSATIKTQSDFAVAGRSLTPWVLVGTMLATWIGTGSILGNAGKTYEMGLAALMLPLGGVFGIFLLTKIAGKVRTFEKFTVPEILGDRYGSEARILSVIALVIAYMVIVSYQYNAGGAVLTTILTDANGDPMISAQTGTIIAAVFIIAYTMLAGLVSVAYTDVGNGIIMTVSLMFAFPILWMKAGGWTGMEVAFTNMGHPEKMQFFGRYTTMDILNFCLPSFLLVLGDANMYQRFFASKDAEGAKRATTYLVFFVLIIELLIIASAWVSSSMIMDAANGKHVLIYAAHELLPPVLGAIMMTTIVGIIISTADSFLLVPATTLMRDVYLQYVDKNANEKKIVLLSRLMVLVLGIIAYIVSLGFANSAGFFEKALYAYTIYGAAITPVLVAALFWKKASKVGAIISIISGTLTTLVWKEANFIRSIIPEGIYNTMDEVLPAITISVLGLVVGSILYPDRELS